MVLLSNNSKLVSSVLIRMNAPGNSIDRLALSILPSMLLNRSVSILVFRVT